MVVENSNSSAGFKYRKGEYYCEKLPVADLAERYDTPLYLYSQNYYLHRLRQLQEAIKSDDSLVCFAVKSNSNLALLQTLAQSGCGFDIVSGGELKRALKAGADPEKIVYSGVGKTESEQRLALKADIYMFNIESKPELEQLNKIAGELGKNTRVAIRVNPAVDAQTHEKITTGKKENKFGIPLPRVEAVANRIQQLDNVEFRGLHFHIGSQITDPEPFERLAKKARDLVLSLEEQRINVRTLNLGGGLGACYDNEDILTAEEWYKTVSPYLKDLNIKLIIEPGRFLMANAGLLVTSVTYVKKSVTRNFIVVDAGMNTLIRPAMYSAFHKIIPIIPRNEETITADIVGPVCETGDTFGEQRTLPEPRPGDYLGIMGAGAYGSVMASRYNSFPQPAEVLVNKNSRHLVRERDKYEDLWKKEKMLT